MRRRTDINRVYRSGRHNSARLLAVRSLPNGLTLSRCAYSISRRVGNAVVRNRVRRRLREAVRSLPTAEGFDIVIVARPEAAAADYESLRAELSLLFGRARMLTDRA